MTTTNPALEAFNTARVFYGLPPVAAIPSTTSVDEADLPRPKLAVVR